MSTLKVLLSYAFVILSVNSHKDDNITLAKPTEGHLQFYEDNLGAIIHFNMQTFVPKNERKCANKWDPNTFDPYLLDTDVWLSSASSFGAKYAVMVCDHFSGFSTFPTSAHNYSVKYSQWQNGTGNVIEDFVKSAHKYNIRPAIYYSVHENWYYNICNFNYSNTTNNSQQLQQEFEDMIIQQLTEIVNIFNKYGSNTIGEIWFDDGVKQSLSFINRVNNFIVSEIMNSNPNATCHSCGAMVNTRYVSCSLCSHQTYSTKNFFKEYSG